MSAEENKALVCRAYEEFMNKGNMAAADEVYATNVVSHPAAPGVPAGLEGYKQWFTMVRAALPDFQVTVEDMIAEGDKVAVLWTGSGTHKGEFMGVAPTGKQLTITGIAISRIAGGKIVEDWACQLAPTIAEQLGVKIW